MMGLIARNGIATGVDIGVDTTSTVAIETVGWSVPGQGG